MKRSHYILSVILLVASVILLVMNIVDLFTGGNVRWFDMVLCPIVAIAMTLRLRQAHKEKATHNNDAQ